MVNPASIMKLMNAKNKFAANHPKFSAFLNAVFKGGIQEGTIIEITVTKPGEAPITSNLRVSQSDIELMQELQNISKQFYIEFYMDNILVDFYFI